MSDEKFGKNFLTISVKIMLGLAGLAVMVVYAGVNNGLHPPRIIPLGYSLVAV